MPYFLACRMMSLSDKSFLAPESSLFPHTAPFFDLQATLLIDGRTDLELCAMGYDDLEPVGFRLLVFRGDNFDPVARLKLRVQTHDLAVHLRTDTAIANLGVNGIGKVDRCGARRHGFHIPFRSKNVNLVVIEIEFEPLHERGRRVGILDQLPGPVEETNQCWRHPVIFSPCTASAPQRRVRRTHACASCGSATRPHTLSDR